jgi:hypothetical protein
MFYDNETVRDTEDQVNALIPYAQNIYNQFKGLGIEGLTLSIKEISRLKSACNIEVVGKHYADGSIKNFIVEKIKSLKKTIDIGGGIKLKFEDLVSNGSYPLPNFNSLYAAAEEMAKVMQMSKFKNFQWNLMKIDGDTVCINQDEMEKLKEYHKYYAKTPKQKRLYIRLKKVADEINEAIEEGDIKEVIKWSVFSDNWFYLEDGKYKVRYRRIIQEADV